MTDFAPPDLDSPLDVDARVAAVPEKAKVRGMFFQDVHAALKKAGLPVMGRESYVAFKFYPIRDYLRVTADGAQRLYPDLPLRRGLYLLGHDTYPRFAETMLGKAVFATVMGNLGDVLDATKRAYPMVLNPGRAEVLESGEGMRVMGLRDVWSFADCLHFGVFAGGMKALRVEGDIAVRVHSVTDVDIRLRWTPRQ